MKKKLRGDVLSSEIFASTDLAANVKQFPPFMISYRMCTFFCTCLFSCLFNYISLCVGYGVDIVSYSSWYRHHSVA